MYFRGARSRLHPIHKAFKSVVLSNIKSLKQSVSTIQREQYQLLYVWVGKEIVAVALLLQPHAGCTYELKYGSKFGITFVM